MVILVMNKLIKVKLNIIQKETVLQRSKIILITEMIV